MAWSTTQIIAASRWEDVWVPTVTLLIGAALLGVAKRVIKTFVAGVDAERTAEMQAAVDRALDRALGQRLTPLQVRLESLERGKNETHSRLTEILQHLEGREA